MKAEAGQGLRNKVTWRDVWTHKRAQTAGRSEVLHFISSHSCVHVSGSRSGIHGLLVLF